MLRGLLPNVYLKTVYKDTTEHSTKSPRHHIISRNIGNVVNGISECVAR